MSTPDLEVVRLLDEARARLGSDYKVAKTLRVPQQHVSEWRTGKRTCVPADRALLAFIAGLDAQEELTHATLSRYEGTPRGEMLRKALGNGLRAAGAAGGSALLVLTSLICWTPDALRTMSVIVNRYRLCR